MSNNKIPKVKQEHLVDFFNALPKDIVVKLSEEELDEIVDLYNLKSALFLTSNRITIQTARNSYNSEITKRDLIPHIFEETHKENGQPDKNLFELLKLGLSSNPELMMKTYKDILNEMDALLKANSLEQFLFDIIDKIEKPREASRLLQVLLKMPEINQYKLKATRLYCQLYGASTTNVVSLGKSPVFSSSGNKANSQSSDSLGQPKNIPTANLTLRR